MILPGELLDEKLSPLVRFGDPLEVLVSARQQASHMTFQNHGFDQPAGKSERRFELHHVLHHGPPVLQREVVVMAKAVKHPAHHGILKIAGRIVCGDAAGMRDIDSEVAPSPCHLLAGTNQT